MQALSTVRVAVSTRAPVAVAPTHPLGDAQGAQAFHGIQVEVILSLASDFLLMPSSGVI